MSVWEILIHLFFCSKKKRREEKGEEEDKSVASEVSTSSVKSEGSSSSSLNIKSENKENSDDSEQLPLYDSDDSLDLLDDDDELGFDFWIVGSHDNSLIRFMCIIKSVISQGIIKQMVDLDRYYRKKGGLLLVIVYQ